MAQHATISPQHSERIRVLAADSTRMSSQLLAQALAQDIQFHVTGIEPKPAALKSPMIFSAMSAPNCCA